MTQTKLTQIVEDNGLNAEVYSNNPKEVNVLCFSDKAKDQFVNAVEVFALNFSGFRIAGG